MKTWVKNYLILEVPRHLDDRYFFGNNFSDDCNKFKIVTEYLEANCVFRKSTDFLKLSLFWAYSEDVEN